MNQAYVQWRMELTAIKTSIDAFDEAFWDRVCDDNVAIADYYNAEAEHNIARQKMVDELDAHFAKEPNHD